MCPDIKKERMTWNSRLLLYSLIFLTGFASFGFEIIAQAQAVIYIGSSNIAMGLVISMFILGYLSSIPFGLWADKKATFGHLFATFIGIGLFSSILLMYTGELLSQSPALAEVLSSLPVFSYVPYHVYLLLIISIFVSLVPFFMGGTIPIAMKLLTMSLPSTYGRIGSITGVVFTLDSLGSALGGTITAIYLLNLWGKSRLELILGLSMFITVTILAATFFYFYRFSPRVSHKKTGDRSPIGGGMKRFGRKVSSHRWGLTWALVAAIIVSTLIVNISPIKYGGQQYRFEGVVIYYEETPFNEIAVTVHPEIDLTLYQNGKVVFSQLDHFQFFEPFVHVPMMYLSSPQRVLVLGGGSGGVILEVLKYPSVSEIVVVEEDSALVNVVKQHFSDIQNDVFDDSRVTIDHSGIVDYVLNRVAQSGNSTPIEPFDCIIIDQLEPRTEHLARYYTAEFYQNVSRLLKYDGVVVSQASSPIMFPRTSLVINRTMSDTFNVSRLFSTDVWSLGPYMFCMASRNETLFSYDLDVFSERFSPLSMSNKLYTPFNHPGFLYMAMTNNLRILADGISVSNGNSTYMEC